MVTKRMVSTTNVTSPEPLDEGWWASVLSNEAAIMPDCRTYELRPMLQADLCETDWQYVQQVFENDEVLTLRVYGFNRGGLLVQGERIQGFVPISHLVEINGNLEGEKRRAALSAYLNRTLRLKVIECEPTQNRVVLSERAALAGEGRRRALFDTLKEGTVINGRVTNITDFGVFVDLGGVEGLIHVSELSWGRVQHPRDIVQVGDDVRVMVLQVSEENARIALSLKRLTPNPWLTLAARYKPGDIVPARITAVAPYGAFARLEEGVEGLIHVSSIDLPAGVKSLDHFLQIGQAVQVRILHIDVDRRRLGLGFVCIE
ncbi:S1 RNA-binding domain-containing protein [uncultured Thermanaerothrix sp.]|uniref:30S ribosomal protein S1 n=1 Tax=uncultured Thermanaerothrix sp. TaxID=1195149 RepID=UPI00263381B7|nr:S1 RNA-binding domain-containing protein [uncultured Thermanaerothrix sp.]